MGKSTYAVKSKSGKIYLYDSNRYRQSKSTIVEATAEIKRSYLLRYQNGEASSKLGLELYILGYTKSKGKIGNNYYPGVSMLFNWLYRDGNKMKRTKNKGKK